MNCRVSIRARRSGWSWITMLLPIAAPAAAGPPIEFIECLDCGIEPYRMAEGMGGGLAAADYDDDGFVDVFVPTEKGTPDRLYRNLGNGRFEEIATAVGLASLRQSRVALWLDFDGDGRLDLLVANDDPAEESTFRLFRQERPRVTVPPRFVDVTKQCGLFVPLPAAIRTEPRHRGGLCAGDLNGDGYPEVVAAMWNGWPRVLANIEEGSGRRRFRDVTQRSGITTVEPYSHQPVMLDVNGDGGLDLYIAVDFGPNALWLNRGGGHFVDIAPPAGADSTRNDMGVAVGDYDRDGDFDLYVTNITRLPRFHNVLLRNDTRGRRPRFHEVSKLLAVAEGGWGWGVTFIDADNDGWLDLAATNGWSEEPHRDDASRFFWNRPGDADQPVRFEDVSDLVGFEDRYWGSALISFDFERDGDLDLLQSTKEGRLRLLLNRPHRVRDGSEPGGFLLIRPRMPGPNSRALGAIVRVETGGQRQVRLIGAGTSYLGQEPAEAFFGVGAARLIDRVEVLWPGGDLTLLRDVAPDQVIEVRPGD